MSLPISDRRIRIAVVGCGRISGKHCEVIFRSCADLELVAICN